jgi:hypothetical protein
MKRTTSVYILQIDESRLKQVSKTYFYLKNKYGIDLIKMQIKNLNLYLITVVFTNMMAMLLHNVVLFKKVYKM